MYFCLAQDQHVGVPDASCSQVTTFLVNYKGRPYMVALKDNTLLHNTVCCRANMAHIKQPRPEYGFVCQVKVLIFSSNLSPSVGR